MAEQARVKQNQDEESEQKKKMKDSAMHFGLLAFSSFLSGLAMAAGAHVYHSAATKVTGRNYKGNVTPIRHIS